MRKIVAAIAAVSFSFPASAGIITFEYTGIVNHLQEPAHDGPPAATQVIETALIPGTVRMGDKFRGRFSFDTDAPSSFTGMPGTIDYGRRNVPVAPAATLKFERSGLVLKSHELMPLVQIGYGDGFFLSKSYIHIDPAFGAAAPFRFGLSLRDGGSDALPDHGLPTSFNLSAFGDNEFRLTYSADDYRSVGLRGELTSLVTVSDVPEPSSYALLVAGLAVLGASTLRQRRV